MLVITYDNDESLEWHVREKMPLPGDIFAESMLDDANVKHIAQLQADGDELRLIKELFNNTIPMPEHPVVRWYGDVARTIYLNLYDWKVEDDA